MVSYDYSFKQRISTNNHTVMVARDVVVFLQKFYADPFQSGFDSQHRQDMYLGLKMKMVKSHRIVKIFWLFFLLVGGGGRASFFFLCFLVRVTVGN